MEQAEVMFVKAVAFLKHMKTCQGFVLLADKIDSENRLHSSHIASISLSLSSLSSIV